MFKKFLFEISAENSGETPPGFELRVGGRVNDAVTAWREGKTDDASERLLLQAKIKRVSIIDISVAAGVVLQWSMNVPT